MYGILTTTCTRITSNLDDTCAEIRAKGINYAEWQKTRYARLYDVKSTIENDIELMHYKAQERERMKLCNRIHNFYERMRKYENDSEC